MQIKKFVLGMFETNGYLIWGNKPGSCLIVDPADEGERMVDFLKESELVPEAILLTHGHYDHFLGIGDLQKEWPQLAIYCHPADCPKEKEEYDPMMRRSFPTISAFSNIREVKEGTRLNLAGFDIRTLHTPGHTPGSVIFTMSDVMFSGDTLFKGSIGRTDFAGGDDRQMKQSLKRLAAIEEDYRVYPGHEGETTLKTEQKKNPSLKILY